MNRYKFSEEEVPYGTLEQFGLTREMVGDLPVDVLQAIQSGRRSPVLPIRADDSEGNTIHVEKPRDFDPFGQAGLSPLATI